MSARDVIVFGSEAFAMRDEEMRSIRRIGGVRILCFTLHPLQTCTCLFNEFFYLTGIASLRKPRIMRARFEVIWHRHVFE